MLISFALGVLCRVHREARSPSNPATDRIGKRHRKIIGVSCEISYVPVALEIAEEQS